MPESLEAVREDRDERRAPEPRRDAPSDGRQGSRRVVIAWLALGLAWLVGAFNAASVYGLLNDDAMITLRCVANFVDGQGWVYNPGELLETSVHPLWVWMLTVVAGFGVDPVDAAAALSFLGTLVSLTVTGWLAWKMLPAVAAWAPVWWVAASPTLMAQGGTGLETTFFAALLTLAVGLTVLDPVVSNDAAASEGRMGLRSSFRSWRGPLLLGLTSWLRLNAAPLAFIVVVLRALLRAPKGNRIRVLLRDLVVVAATVGAITLWRLLYYGDALPNVVYTKVRPGFSWDVYDAGLRYVQSWLQWDLGAAVAGCGLLLALCAGRPAALLALAGAAGIAGVVGVGGDFMPYHRFCAPLLPVIAVAVAVGLARALRSPLGGDGPPPVRWALCAGAILLGLQPAARLVSEGNQLVRNARVEAFRADVGRWLRKRADEHEAEELPMTVALGAAGFMGYYAGPDVRVVDILGLCDRHIAREGHWDLAYEAGHQRGDGAYVLEQRPEVIILGSVSPGDVFQQPAFRDHLQEIHIEGLDAWQASTGIRLSLAERQMLEAERLWREFRPLEVELPDGRTFRCLERVP